MFIVKKTTFSDFSKGKDSFEMELISSKRKKQERRVSNNR